MNWWVGVRYKLLLWTCQLTGLLPDWFLYRCLLPVLYWLLYRVVRYRRNVVRMNLGNSFPEKTADEIKSIEKEFYRHLAEVFIDTVDMSSISPRAILKRINIVGLQEHEAATQGKDWIAAIAHYGSWEYFSAYQLLTDAQVAGVYKPLRSPVMDEFYKNVRTRFGMEAVSNHSLMRYIARHKLEVRDALGSVRNIAVGMIADQTPRWHDIHYWFDFLGQPTPFFEGVERLGLKFEMPVYFLRLRKTGVGRYDGWFEQIYDGCSPVEPYQITLGYIKKLEEAIRAQPAYWMWSHRRWKRRPGVEPDFITEPIPIYPYKQKQ